MNPYIKESYEGGLIAGLTPGQWSATRVFYAVGYASKLDALNALTAQFGVLQGIGHPDNRIMVCQTIECDDGFARRKITVSYAITAAGSSDPTQWLTRWRWQPGTVSEQTQQDFYGNPILNSAATPFQSDFANAKATMTLTATRNEPFYDAQKAIRIQNTTNSTTFRVQGGGLVFPGQCLIRSMTADGDIYDGLPYVPVVYTFELRAGDLIDNSDEYDAFWDIRLDQGEHGWYDAGTAEAPNPQRGLICNKDGLEVGQVNLDGYGMPIDKTLKILKTGHAQRPVADPIQCPIPLPQGVRTVSQAAGGAGANGAVIAVYLAWRRFGQTDILTLNL